MQLRERARVAFGIEQADEVEEVVEVLDRRLGQIAVFWLAALKEHRLALLGLRLGLFTDDGFDHRFDRPGGAQEDL